MDRLKGKAAIVTGGGKRHWPCHVEAVRQRRRKGHLRRPADAVSETAKAIKDAGGTAIALTADASSEIAVAHAVDTAVKEFGKTRCLLRQRRHIGRRSASLLRIDGGALAPGARGEFDRRVSRDQACGARDGAQQEGLDRLHGFGGRHPLRGRRRALQREQGRRDQSHDDCGELSGRNQCARECDLSRHHRDRQR